jgi:hypothetical protein
MEWLNIHVPMLRAPEYVGSDPISRATWLNVTVYCVEQENGGRIVGAASWKDRQWQQTCGVTFEEVISAKKLLEIEGDDVLVWRYPVEKEAAVKQQRESGKLGGRPVQKPSDNHRVIPKENPRVNPPKTLPHNGKEGEGKGNRKEKGKGKEEDVISFCLELGLPESDGVATFLKWEANGWTNSGKAIRDWKGTIRAWKAAGYMPSQKPGNGTAPKAPNPSVVKRTKEEAESVQRQADELNRQFLKGLMEGPQ